MLIKVNDTTRVESERVPELIDNLLQYRNTVKKQIELLKQKHCIELKIQEGQLKNLQLDEFIKTTIFDESRPLTVKQFKQCPELQSNGML